MPIFKDLMIKISEIKNKIQQSEFSYLTPPSLRVKSRFANLTNILNWLNSVLNCEALHSNKNTDLYKNIIDMINKNIIFVKTLSNEQSCLNKIQKK